MLYYPGFGDLQPYETFRICSESGFGVFPDLFQISLKKCLTVLGWLSKAPDPFCFRNFPLIFLEFPLNIP